MNWKNILKKLTLDPMEMCCTNLVLGYYEITNQFADHLEKNGFEGHANGVRQDTEQFMGLPPKLVCGAVKEVLENNVRAYQTSSNRKTSFTDSYIKRAQELLREYKECIQFGKTMRDKSMGERR
jgi:hypothetical protein